MMKKTKGTLIYHGQATKDVYADRKDNYDHIPSASTKDIQAAYKEFLNELMLESQEAY